MATLYGANATKINAMKPTSILDAGSSGGKVRCFIDTYTGLGTESAADVIEMGPELPKGAIVLLVGISCDTIGGTPDVGDYEDPDRYVDEASDNATTLSNDVKTSSCYQVDMTTASTPDNQIIVTLDAAVTLNGTIKVFCLYTVE